MEALSSLETMLIAGLGAAALALAVWSARQAVGAAASRATGETAWSLVAVAMLAVVWLAVRLGGPGGI